MSIPLQITFRHMPSSKIFENRIRELAHRFEKFSSNITHCHVVIETPNQSPEPSTAFDVHITLSVPDRIISVRRSHANDPRRADAYVALRDAFNAAKRQLQDYERVRRGAVKTHAAHPEEAPTP